MTKIFLTRTISFFPFILFVFFIPLFFYSSLFFIFFHFPFFLNFLYLLLLLSLSLSQKNFFFFFLFFLMVGVLNSPASHTQFYSTLTSRFETNTAIFFLLANLTFISFLKMFPLILICIRFNFFSFIHFFFFCK